MKEKRFTLKIMDVIYENEKTVTFIFKHKIKSGPGQFIMLSDLESGEKPFSISSCDGSSFGVTMKSVGEFTGRLSALKPGDMVSVRGPYGSTFTIPEGKRCLITGGGCGVPPLFFLAGRLIERNNTVTLVTGFKTGNEAMCLNEFEKIGIRPVIMTDDGSLGGRGTVVDAMRDILNKERLDMIYAAGPEIMLKKVMDDSDDIPCEILVERYMKCAIGICGQCAMDPIGLRVCVEGPVLNKRAVGLISEFGAYRRDASGAKEFFCGATH
jgi:dihydroorotate dehydrogenase electron transfer subunit